MYRKSELSVGDRAKFFHPGTMGVMLWGEVKEVNKFSYVVKFDDPHPTNGNHTFFTYKEYIQ
jgi:hypothetical protein